MTVGGDGQHEGQRVGWDRMGWEGMDGVKREVCHRGREDKRKTHRVKTKVLADHKKTTVRRMPGGKDHTHLQYMIFVIYTNHD